MRCLTKKEFKICSGPYSIMACQDCLDKEGTCLKPGKPDVACKGPLVEAGRCKSCAREAKDPAFIPNDADRIKARAWRVGLKLSEVNVADGQVFDAGSWGALTASQIDQKYQEELHPKCPWVRIGRLYTTVTTANDGGWGGLITTKLYQEGHRKFAVFTGRHGVQHGTIVQDGSDLFTDNVPDANHIKEDIVAKAKTLGCYVKAERPTITLWDVGTTAGTTMSKTKRLAIECLRNGEIVIFAWCWSFLSVHKVKTATAANKLYDGTLHYNKPISEIVKDQYGWVDVSELARWATKADRKYANWRRSVGQVEQHVEQHELFRGHQH